jgi:hypothetical protein
MKLNIELSEHNQDKLLIALCAEFRRSVHTLTLFEQSDRFGTDRYGVKFQIDGLIGQLIVYVDKSEQSGPNMKWAANEHYYKLSCDDCVWYVTYNEMADVNGFARGIGNVVREYIKRHV